MAGLTYRYVFRNTVPVEELEQTLLLTIIAAESLHGASQTSLDMTYAFHPEKRLCEIAADSKVGRDCNRLFMGFLSREFGRGSFEVERVGAKPEPSAV